MAEEKISTVITAILVGAVTGLYGFFIRHIIRHPDRAETNDQIQQLWDKKQSVDRCEQIVKRLDENHKETCKKLDRLINLAESKTD